MNKGTRVVGIGTTIFIALVILSVSVFSSTNPRSGYAYSPMVLSEKIDKDATIKTVDYVLAYQGRVNPDSPFWYIKVIRDKSWYVITFNNAKKAELNLLFADKRLNSSLELFKNNKPDLGLSTLIKAEKYLELSEKMMTEDEDFYKKIGLASLKHREVIENEILPLSPEDLRPAVIKSVDYPVEVYKKVKDHMLLKGLVPPVNPFELK